MSKIAKKIKLFGFRLSDTTALLLFFVSIIFLLTGFIGLLTTATGGITIIPSEYLGWMYFMYIISIFIGFWLFKKSLKYRKYTSSKYTRERGE